MIFSPRRREHATKADKGQGDQDAKNEIMGGKNKLVFFVGLEKAHNLRSCSSDRSIPESVPTPCSVQSLLSKQDSDVITELLRKKLC